MSQDPQNGFVSVMESGGFKSSNGDFERDTLLLLLDISALLAVWF
jgi:hypothetical protein